MKQMKLMLVLMILALSFSGCKQSSTVEIVPVRDQDVSEKNSLNLPSINKTEDIIQNNLALVISDESVSLGAEEIHYTILNNTGKTAQIVFAPHLERKIVYTWETVIPEGIGFCGVPDPVETKYSGSLPLSWYGDQLTPGEYRLSFAVSAQSAELPESKITAEFTIGDAK